MNKPTRKQMAAAEARLAQMTPLPAEESRLYWLSFADDRRPPGKRSLGVSIVRVSGAEANDEIPELVLFYPNHDPIHGPWVAAAARKAWALKINPGGEVLTQRLDDQPNMPAYPENVALTPEQIREFGRPRK